MKLKQYNERLQNYLDKNNSPRAIAAKKREFTKYHLRENEELPDFLTELSPADQQIYFEEIRREDDIYKILGSNDNCGYEVAADLHEVGRDLQKIDHYILRATEGVRDGKIVPIYFFHTGPLGRRMCFEVRDSSSRREDIWEKILTPSRERIAFPVEIALHSWQVALPYSRAVELSKLVLDLSRYLLSKRNPAFFNGNINNDDIHKMVWYEPHSK